MTKLTGTEIIEILKKHYSYTSFAYGEWNDVETDVTKDYEKSFGDKEEWTLNKLGLGKVENVEDYGGEGMGETRYVVWYFKDHDVYIRIDGYYQSYNGSEWEEEPYEVKPVQRMVTFYE